MPVRKVAMSKEKPEVFPCGEDRRRLAISEVDGKMYFGLHYGDVFSKDSKKLYKLHSMPGETPRRFCWIAMWNSVVYTSLSKGKYFETIEAALDAAITDGWKVSQVNYDSFELLIAAIEREHRNENQ